MPYADPDKKKAYMAKYNKQWYSQNKGTRKLVERAVDRKKTLRQRKKAWLISAIGGCESCESETMDAVLKDNDQRIRWGPQDDAGNPKAIYDYSWSELQTNLPNFEIRCDCD
jgi:hypothetical protein